MTRALRAPATGVLLADQRSGGVLLLDDFSGDGTADLRRTFFDGANALGLGVPANPFTILQTSDGAVYVGDGASDTVYRLHDRDRSGAANGPGEATVWLSEANAAGLTLPTPNGLAEGPDGAIYVVNAGVAARPFDAIYRTVDLDGDGSADGPGEATVWLDLTTISPTSAPFELTFIGDVAYLIDPNGSNPATVWRIADRDGSGHITPDEVSVFIDANNPFGVSLDFSLAADGDSVLLWEWLDPAREVWSLWRLTDRNGSGAVDRQDEAEEVWNSTLLPEPFRPFAGFSVAADGWGRVALTSNGADPAQRFVALLQDFDGDGAFWGEGETGVLGSALDDPAQFLRPRAVAFHDAPTGPAPTLLGGGNHFSLFLDYGTNTVFAAGENVAGQLGQGVVGFDVAAPIPVALPDGFSETIVSVSAGLVHGSFLTESGQVWTWGLGTFGRLGHGDAEDRSAPTRIEGTFDGLRVTLIDRGNGASYAVTEDGGLWAWGQNTNGQLGLGDLANRTAPVRVAALDGEAVVALASGTAHTLALTESGRVFAWGQNRQGQLGSPEGLDGDGQPLIRVASPVEVAGLPEGVAVTAVSASTLTSYAVLEDGRVFGWGEGRFGQLLQGADAGEGTFAPDRDAVLAPVELVGLPPNVVDVKGGARWAVALTADGDVWLWGPNDEGPTGGLDGDPAAQSELSFRPVKLTGLDAPFIAEIATGPNHVLARAEDGAVFSFGANADGRLGYLTDGLTTEPAVVPLGEPTPPFLLSADAGDGVADPTANIVMTFTEAVTAGDGAIRLVNRADPADVIEIAAADTRRVSVDGDTVVVDPPGFLRPGARYAVELDADAFRDADGLGVGALPRPGWPPVDLRVDPAASALIGTADANRLAGTAADELILIGPGNAIVAGGGGADTFFFGQTTENGVRETVTIRDFDVTEDRLDLGGVGVAAVRATARDTILTLDGDGDRVVLTGVTDFDALLFA